MMRGNKIVILAFILLSRTGILFSQDLHFSQFYLSPTLLNPATAGASGADFRIAAIYRDQWRSVIAPYKTFSIAFDSKIFTEKKVKETRLTNYFGYGISFLSDRVGVSKLTTNQVNLDLSYHLYLNNFSSISAGVKTGMFQKTLNTNGLKWDAQYNGKDYDASLSNQETSAFQNIMQFDLGAGAMYKYDRLSRGTIIEVGGAIAHITRPKTSFAGTDPSLDMKYSGNVLMQLRVAHHSYIVPAAMFALQGKHMEITGGANYKYVLGEHTKDKGLFHTSGFSSSALLFGAFLRYNDAVYFTAGFEYKHSMMFGLSYDVNVSKLYTASKRRGGIEISFIYLQPKKSKLKYIFND